MLHSKSRYKINPFPFQYWENSKFETQIHSGFAADGIRHQRILLDLRDLFQYNPVIEYVLKEEGLRTLQQLFECFFLLTGMDAYQRAEDQHVAYESQDWMAACVLEVLSFAVHFCQAIEGLGRVYLQHRTRSQQCFGFSKKPQIKMRACLVSLSPLHRSTTGRNLDCITSRDLIT